MLQPAAKRRKNARSLIYAEPKNRSQNFKFTFVQRGLL